MEIQYLLERPLTADTLALLSKPTLEEKLRIAATELQAALAR